MDILFAQQAVEGSASILSTLPPLILMFLIFYFIVIRPQSKERKNHEELLKTLSKGDRILSSGGLIGKIVEFQGKESEIVIIDSECGSNLKIRRSFILKKINNSKES